MIAIVEAGIAEAPSCRSTFSCYTARAGPLIRASTFSVTQRRRFEQIIPRSSSDEIGPRSRSTTAARLVVLY
jgi:hypothetical protein